MANHKDHLDMSGLDYPLSQVQQQGPPNKEQPKVLRCDICGTITHKVERTLFGKKKIPLTIEGKCIRGICLICNGPAAPPMHMPQHHQMHIQPTQSGVPHELLVRAPDDATVVSAITLDHRFDAPDDSDEESANFRVDPGQRRPEPSLGDPDEYERPAPLRRKRDSRPRTQPLPPFQPDHQRDNFQHNPNTMPQHMNNNNSHNNMRGDSPWMASQMAMSSYEMHEHHPYSMQRAPQVPQIYENQIYEQQQQHQQLHQQQPQQQQQHHHLMPVVPGQPHMSQQQRTMSPPSFQNQQQHYSAAAEMPPSISSYGQEEKTEIEPTSHNVEWGGGGAAAGRIEPGPGLTGKGTYSHTLNDIPDLVNRLNSSHGDHANVIQSLAEAVWENGQQAKIVVMQLNGLQGVTRAMWENMADGIEVQEAALNLIFALASSIDGEAESDVFIGSDAEDAVDALLIVMQTHLTVENIQHTGCGTLACLAAASGNNPKVDDASLSGALITVVSAMEAHRNSKGVQVLGIRALYNQCVYSRSAESNKRSLAKAGMEDNKCGATVIYRAIEISEADMVTMEWACRLYWCLSASEDVAEFLTVTNHPLYVLLEALQRFHEIKEAGGLIEAIFGALANLVKVRENHKVVDSSIFFVVVKAAKIHNQNENLLVEACALIANLVSFSTENAEAAVKADAINVIFNALKSFSSSALFEEALRSLTILCHTSDDIKRYLCTPAMLSCLAQACEVNSENGAYGQEMYIQLMASLLTRKGLQHTVVARGGVDMLLAAMKAYPNDRKVQEAGCLALRNLACHHDDLNIDFGEPISLIMQAMVTHESSEKVQLNGCCTLWNLASIDTRSRDTDMIHCLVKAMQMHMESAAVLEMACGALCAKIKGSQEGKELVIQSGGLDAVTCVLIMHPSEPGAIEKAFGVLSCMSSCASFADDVASAQTTSNVAIAMRANSTCISLLEFGCLVLRNIILVRPEHVEEAGSVVATVLKGMREHPDAVSYQREACCLLWSMAAMSEKCKAKILSLDGITVLLGCLEHNSSFSDVQDAALGAFNQLTPGMGT